MPKDPLDSARALQVNIGNRLKEIEAERIRLERQMLEVAQFLKAADQYARLKPGELPQLTHSFMSDRHNSSRTRPRNPRREDVLEVVVRTLTSAQRPMRLREIYDAVTAQGINLTGTAPVAVLGTMLWRGGQDRTLVNLKGFGYWPSHLPYAPAAYEPGMS